MAARAGRDARRGFVGNEPLIVLAIFFLLCLIVAGAIGAAAGLAWHWRATLCLGLFVLGIGAFLLLVSVFDRRERRAKDAKAGSVTEPPDAPS